MRKVNLFVLSLFMCCLCATAQKIGKQSSSMNNGESISYDIYFKWGLIMPRAGDATFTYNKDNSVDSASWRYRLDFKTTKFFDAFYKMRDTLSCYYNADNKLIYSHKATDEGSYYAIDELTFKYLKEKTEIHSYRYTPTRVRLDTTLTAFGDVTDLLGVIYYLRGLDRNNFTDGEMFPLTVAIGKDLVNIQFCYQSQSIVEHGNVKYNTRYFKINIYDEAFESTTTSAEVWIGDDDNFLPVKVRSKLKIGYAEIYYRSSSNLKHPLKSRIEIKK